MIIKCISKKKKSLILCTHIYQGIIKIDVFTRFQRNEMIARYIIKKVLNILHKHLSRNCEMITTIFKDLNKEW